MNPFLAYPLAAGAGVLIAFFISRPPELRFMRQSQLILVPAALVLCVSAPGDLMGFVFFLPVLGLLVLLLAPNLAYFCGAAFGNFLDPPHWTSAEEDIALRPIRRLIDKDQCHQALAALDVLLKSHVPTYEALLLKAKLLHLCGRLQETVAALLNSIPLCQTTAQQLAVMELLALLENYQRSLPKPPSPGVRRIQIQHDLVLFQLSGVSSPLHKEIPSGAYEVEEILHRNGLWLKLAGDNWGNAAMCWEAILAARVPASPPRNKGFLWRIARFHRAVGASLKCKSRPQSRAEARQLLLQASLCIRANDWQKALPLLKNASALDPDRYEIAYRWVQAVRHTGGDAAAAEAVNHALAQSQWTENEKQMLRQLNPSQADAL